MAALCMKQVSALYVALVPKHALATVQITTRTLSRSEQEMSALAVKPLGGGALLLSRSLRVGLEVL